MSETRTTIRMPDDVAERLKNAAERGHRSVNAQMLVYIERGLDQDRDRRLQMISETERSHW